MTVFIGGGAPAAHGKLLAKARRQRADAAIRRDNQPISGCLSCYFGLRQQYRECGRA
jgi:hypothetical protein